MPKIIVLTGAGISAESGLKTFRDSGGLWEGYDVMQVASIQGWRENPELVLNFYNERRAAALNAKPNAGHLALKKLEEKFEVVIITQNVDDLHEQAGTAKVIHLHGEIKKARSSVNENYIIELKAPWQIKSGDKCPKGSQLRPHIVWFGEQVPMMETAMKECLNADIFMVIGTSLVVYPAASLINYIPPFAMVYIIDPNIPAIEGIKNLKKIQKNASVGVPQAVEEILENYSQRS